MPRRPFDAFLALIAVGLILIGLLLLGGGMLPVPPPTEAPQGRMTPQHMYEALLLQHQQLQRLRWAVGGAASLTMGVLLGIWVELRSGQRQ